MIMSMWWFTAFHGVFFPHVANLCQNRITDLTQILYEFNKNLFRVMLHCQECSVSVSLKHHKSSLYDKVSSSSSADLILYQILHQYHNCMITLCQIDGLAILFRGISTALKIIVGNERGGNSSERVHLPCQHLWAFLETVECLQPWW